MSACPTCNRVGLCAECCCVHPSHRARPARSCPLCAHGGEGQLISAETLRRAGVLMREEHGPEHERHVMWAAMANWLFMSADHAVGRGAVCGSCVNQALVVARAYLGEAI